MRLSRLSVSACAFAAFMVAGLAVGSGQAPAPQTQKPAPPPRPPLLHGGNLIMPPDDAIAANGGPVFGLASNPGFYITRNVFRNNNTSRPHYHTMDRWVTVIKGTWWGGTGKVFRPKEMKPMPAGSVMFHPHTSFTMTGIRMAVRLSSRSRDTDPWPPCRSKKMKRETQ